MLLGDLYHITRKKDRFVVMKTGHCYVAVLTTTQRSDMLHRCPNTQFFFEDNSCATKWFLRCLLKLICGHIIVSFKHLCNWENTFKTRQRAQLYAGLWIKNTQTNPDCSFQTQKNLENLRKRILQLNQPQCEAKKYANTDITSYTDSHKRKTSNTKMRG